MTEPESAIAVTAKGRGYYGGKVREPGETFVIASAVHFSKAWMERLPVVSDPGQPLPVAPAPAQTGNNAGSGDGKPGKPGSKARTAAA